MAAFFPQLVKLGWNTGVVYPIEPGAISVPGTGYLVSDTFSPTDPNSGFGDASFTVLSVNGSGGITSASTALAFKPYPNSTFAQPQAITGGTGAGCQMSFNASNPLVGASCSTAGSGFPASFSQFTVSCWACFDRINQQIYISGIGDGGQTYTSPVQSPVGIVLVAQKLGRSGDTQTVRVTVNLYESFSGTELFSGQFDGTCPSYDVTSMDGSELQDFITNVIVSFDSGAQNIGVVANRALLSLTSGGWTAAGSFSNSSFTWDVFSTIPLISAAADVGDVWMLDKYYDLTVSSNLDRWINADLSAVNLPSNGMLGNGDTPVVFLHTTSVGTAAGFFTNGGSGPAWEQKNFFIDVSLAPHSDTDGYASLSSATSCQIFTPGQPGPPTGACGASTKTSVTFTWTPDPNFGAPDSYTLQYRQVGSDTWITITGLTSTSYVLSPVASGSQWEWQVEAIYSGVPTAFSDIVTCSAGATTFQLLSCENAFTMAPPITQLYGFDHLIGMAVVGLLDGMPMSPVIVANDGSVTLPFPASDVKIGLGFRVQLQTPYLDAGAPTVQGRRKNVSAVTVRVEASNGIQVGTNQPDGAALTPPAIAPPWGINSPMTDDPAWSVQKQTYLSPAGQTVTKLVTGDVRVAVTSDWRTPGQVAMQQLQPLPMNILACIPELLEGDITEQGYSGEERPRQRADERRQQQGPGSWMLRR